MKEKGAAVNIKNGQQGLTEETFYLSVLTAQSGCPTCYKRDFALLTLHFHCPHFIDFTVLDTTCFYVFFTFNV